MSLWKTRVVAVTTALLVAGCGSAGGGGGSFGGFSCTRTGGSSSGTGNQIVKVLLDPNTVGKYDPSTVNVKAGQSVEWDFLDNSVPHSVTADDDSFDSCSQTTGAKFVLTFNTPGVVRYHCTLHDQMDGTVVVG